MDNELNIKTNFPYNELSRTEKNKKPYALKCVKHLLASKNVLSNDFIANVLENRKYIDAIQDTEAKYYEHIINKGVDEKLVSYVDLDFSPIGVPKLIFKSIYDKLNAISNYNRVEARDENTLLDKKSILLEMKMNMKLAPAIKEITGFDIGNISDVMDSDIELDVYEKMFGFVTPVEYILQEFLKEVDKLNRYDYEIMPYINYDIICSGVCALHTYFNSSGLIVEEPIDITSLKIIGGGRKRDFNDSQGFIISKELNIDDVIDMINDECACDEKFKEYAEEIKENIQRKAKNGLVKINICYWQAYDTTAKEIRIVDGIMQIRNRNLSYNKGAIKSTTVHKWYTSWHIDGTEYVFKNGEVPNMIRERNYGKNGKAYSPITVIRVNPFSINHRNAPITTVRKYEDLMVNAWLKMQNEIANAMPEMKEWDLDAMNAARELTDFDKVSEMIDYAMQTGNVFKAGISSFDRQNYGRAINITKSGLGSAISEYIQIMKFCKDMAHEMSGIPAVDTGGQQDKRISNYVTKEMLSGTQKTLRELFESKEYLLQLSGEKKLNMILRLAHPNNKLPNPYKTQFSELKAYILELISNMTTIEMGLRLEQGLSDEEKYQIMNDAIMLSQRYRDSNGNDGITPIEYMHFRELMKDNEKYAVYFLGTLIEKRKEQQQKQAERNMMMNAMIQQQSNQANIQGKMELESMKQQGEQQLQQDSKDIDLRNNIIQKGIDAGINNISSNPSE